jgi:uncharacterized membrane protein YeaQ/YmgE (transglycosylase-associated protein family)
MARLSDPVISFLLVLTIGILVGLAAQKVLRTSWLSKQIAGTRNLALTHALVGIAGSFVGLHVATLLTSGGRGSLAPLIGALIGAALVVWAWKTIRV